VWRNYDSDGRMEGDVLSIEDDCHRGEPLIHLVMKDGKRLRPPTSLEDIRQRSAFELDRLPEPLRRLEDATYPVEVAGALKKLAQEVDKRLERAASEKA